MRRADARRLRGRSPRGLSGLGLILVILGLLALAVTYSVVPAAVFRFWPLVFVAVGLFGLLRRPGWVRELDLHAPQVGKAVSRPQRFFSLLLIVMGLVLLVVTLHLVDERILGSGLLIVLGLLLVWRRAR